MPAITSRKTRRLAANAAGLAASAAVLLLLWETLTAASGIPEYLLPRPSAVGAVILNDVRSGLIFPHLLVTATEVVLGFLAAAILGLALGCLVGLSPFAERFVYPYILAIQTIPKVAIAPLMVIWVGFGIQSKIVTAMMVAIFPIIVNVVVGLKTVEPRRVLLMKAFAATPLQTFLKLRLPSMLPYYVAGLEVGVLFAMIGALVGEFLGSAEGLGSLIIRRQASVEVAGVFSVLFFLSLTGIALNRIVRTVGARYAFWAYRGANPSAGKQG
jgi:NitT/TauT family transport system permease protein